MAASRKSKSTKARPRRTQPPLEEARRAAKVLDQARDSVDGFLKAFETVRTARNARGNPTDEEQDLLRAVLVFAAAGLDSAVKELIRGSIRTLAGLDPAVQAELETFVQRQIRGDTEDPDAIGGHKFLAKVLVSPDPQHRLIDEYVVELTGSSLQSPDQLCRAAKALGVQPADVGIDPKKLRPVFEARNKIIHELDVNLEQTRARRNQNSRPKPQMEEWSRKLLHIARQLVDAVETKIRAGNGS